MRDPKSRVNRGNPASDALRLSVFGDVPRGRVVIVGELDLLNAPQLERLLTKLLHVGYRQLSVNASGVPRREHPGPAVPRRTMLQWALPFGRGSSRTVQPDGRRAHDTVPDRRAR
jgi:hypothetical protein